MKKLEVILASISIIAFLLIFMTFPGATELFTIGLSVLSIIYFYLSFALLNNIRLRKIFKKKSYEEVSKTEIVLAILTGVALSVFSVGIMFKMIFLPGADEMLSIGLFFTSVVVIMALTMTKIKQLDFRKLYYRLVPFFILGLILFYTTRDELIRSIYRDHPNYADARIKLLNNPDDPELQKELLEEDQKMFFDQNK